ncbi:hypothetical protein JCM17843_18710 [Kordiimonadales bacterium JCM 17843]|nr:hypothetical protein JCM17843_18710 [Kordiimonadales bacterium JCM 17843]
MRYTSTRADLDCGFSQVVASGLAPDGGLYLPTEWPRLSSADLAALASGSYGDTLQHVGALFADDEVSADSWGRIAEKALAGFRHPAIAPLNQLGPKQWLLELYHGPTLSFKDYGLQPYRSFWQSYRPIAGKNCSFWGQHRAIPVPLPLPLLVASPTQEL